MQSHALIRTACQPLRWLRQQIANAAFHAHVALIRREIASRQMQLRHGVPNPLQRRIVQRYIDLQERCIEALTVEHRHATEQRTTRWEQS